MNQRDIQKLRQYPRMTGQEFQAARHRLKLTQVDMAAKLGLVGKNARQTVRRWEKGEVPVPGPVVISVNCFLSHKAK